MFLRSFLMALGLLMLPITQAAPNVNYFPDYYSEPGLKQGKAYDSVADYEAIDPFSGGVKLNHVDAFIPGNGGADIKIERNYNVQNTNDPDPIESWILGRGWTMHMGRLWRGTVTTSICGNTTTAIMNTPGVLPVFESGDGVKHTFYYNKIDSYGYTIYRSLDGWWASCGRSSADTVNDHFIVFSPEGIRYDLEYIPQTNLVPGQYLSFVTRITYPSGNYLSMSYGYVSGTWVLNSIQGKNRSDNTDGRTITFHYDLPANFFRPRLANIKYNGNTIRTYSSSFDNFHYYLNSVTHPNGQVWLYDYYKTTASAASANNYNLSSVTNPLGGRINYSYTNVQFYNLQTSPDRPSIYQKIVSGGTTGTWTYNFTPASGPGAYDKTTVAGPNGTETYLHYGYKSAVNNTVFAVGTLYRKEYRDKNNTLKRTETYEYTAEPLGEGRNVLPFSWSLGGKYDDKPYIAQLTKRTIDGTAVTQYSNFYGPQLPRTITESSPDNNRTTVVTYASEKYPNLLKSWITTPVYSQQITSDSKGLSGYNTTITKEYYADLNRAEFGQVGSINDYGVVTRFNYDGNGNLYSKTDPMGLTTTYSNYKHGLYQTAALPEGVNLGYLIDDFGRVYSQTDGELKTTGFQYKPYSNHITAIDLPINNDVSASWSWGSNSNRTVTRGNLVVSTTHDGFGRVVLSDARDTTTGKRIVVRSSYDAEGNKTCTTLPQESDPGSCSTSYGDVMEYDVLGRVTKITHPDSKSEQMIYTGLNQVQTIDARGNSRYDTYEYYGNPDSRWLKSSTFPGATSSNLSYTRNFRGLVLTESQAGLTRTYTYTAAGFLNSEKHPELNNQLVNYTYFADGKVNTKVSPAGTTTYSYDNLRRLKTVLFPDNKAYEYSYDRNSMPLSQKVRTGGLAGTIISTRGFGYDANKNLTSESMQLDGQTIPFGYAYNSNDALSTTTYPDNAKVDYLPDAFARPTKAGAYASGASYYPAGQLKSLTWGNNTKAEFALNNRGWVNDVAFKKGDGSAILSWFMSYDGNGNTTAISDRMASLDYNLPTLGYDALNRLNSFNGTMTSNSTRSVVYDGLGNITSYSPGLNKSLSYDVATNRLTGMNDGVNNYSYGYDLNGNINSNGKGQFFNFDHDHNLSTLNLNAASEVQYTYGTNNQLLKQLPKSGTARYFFYNAEGQLLHEREGNKLIDYVYLNDRLVAQREFIPRETTPPTAPGAVTVSKISTSITDYQHKISWGAATDNVGVTGYKVNGLDVGNTTSTIMTLLPNTNYSFGVIAYDQAGNQSPVKGVAYSYPYGGGCSAAYGTSGSKSYLVNASIYKGDIPTRTVTASASIAFPDSALPNNFITSVTIMGGGNSGTGQVAKTCSSSSLTIPRDGGDHPTVASYWAVACDAYGNCAQSSSVSANP